jgi:peroxiredoxin
VLLRLLPLALFVGGCASVPPPPAAAPGALPEVVLHTLDGRATRLDEVRAGRVALVTLWATWCDACVDELDALARLSHRAGARGGLVVAVAVGEPHERVAEFVAGRHLPWPQLVDEQFRFADALGQKRVPATLVIDRAGRVVYAGGALDQPALTALDSALGPAIARH